jgi:hypothetical protein
MRQATPAAHIQAVTPIPHAVKTGKPKSVPKFSSMSEPASTQWSRMASAWDNGNRSQREKILKQFVRDHQNQTGVELDESLYYGASLFLLRLSAWFRLSYA